MRFAFCSLPYFVCVNLRESAVKFLKILIVSKNLACFAALRLAPWNTDSTEVKLFAQSAIPQGEVSFLKIYGFDSGRVAPCAPRFAVCWSAIIGENLRLSY